MKKAILVIDVPEKCGDCVCAYFTEGCYFDRCDMTGKEINFGTKPDWCPLRPLPERKVVTADDTTASVAIKFGWNNCLDEILKGEKNDV